MTIAIIIVIVIVLETVIVIVIVIVLVIVIVIVIACFRECSQEAIMDSDFGAFWALGLPMGGLLECTITIPVAICSY